MNEPEPIPFKDRLRDNYLKTARPFRGEIWENASRFKLVGKAYEAMPADQNGHFIIASARHLIGILRALLDPAVRTVIIIGATQVLKSIVGDIWVPFIIEHAPRNMLVLFEDDPKAKKYCDVRLMDTIKRHPFISDVLREDVDRNDATKTFIKLPSMTIMVAGLNDGNVSTLSWPLIWVSEAWQHKSDGLLRKAIKRADRFPDDCKILIESQPGMAGEDLHTEAKSAHQVPLTWACPLCGGRQEWEFGGDDQLRPEGFVSKTPDGPKPGTYAGMKFDPSEKEIDGKTVSLSIDERARSAWWECYHCGGRIDDTKENRQKIAESYGQDYQITSPDGFKFSPKAVCFYLPKEAATGNSFENSAKAYLSAKEAQRSGNEVPLQDWYMAERAKFYDKAFTQTRIQILTSADAFPGTIPGEAARVMKVDCQQGDVAQKTGKFWYVARAIDKSGANLVQLARGYAENWAEWIAVQHRLKIPNSNVAIDGGNYLHEVLDAAAANFEVVKNQVINPRTGKPTGKVIECRSVWKVLIGNGRLKSFPHGAGVHRKFRAFSPPTYYQRKIDLGKGQTAVINIAVYYWSNLSVKDHLLNLMMGGPGKPKFVALTRDQLPAQVQAKETGDLAYEKQMQNEYRTRVNGLDKWEEASPNVHYRDCECGCIVLLDIGGHLGLPAAPDEAQAS